MDGGYFDIVGGEEIGEFVVAVEDAVGVELENVEGLVGGGVGDLWQ